MTIFGRRTEDAGMTAALTKLAEALVVVKLAIGASQAAPPPLVLSREN
jgi:hypothetical protein